jgi:predicted nuclease of predicted toxin-antitoxin system
MKLARILLDEMFAGLKDYLEVLGWSAQTVHDVELKGAKDKDIVEYAKKHDLLLVTQDQKTSELADLIGVRNVFISQVDIAKIADEEIRKKYPNLRAV